MSEIEELIEKWCFEDEEAQKQSFAEHGMEKHWLATEENCYEMGYETGVKRMYHHMLALKEQWQREAWEAARIGIELTGVSLDSMPAQFGVKGFVFNAVFDQWKKTQAKP